MSDNKKYYYMRVKENFYESEDMVILQSMDNGYLYSDILMKLYLRSLKHDGRLMFKEHIPYNPKMIATITGHNIDVVEKSLKIFKELNLIDVLDNGAIYMLDMQNFIGETSTEADRIKAYRKKIKEETILIGNKDVQMYDECTPELELELELETELKKKIDLDIEKENKPKKEKKVSEFDLLISNYSTNEELKTNIYEFIKMRKGIKAAITTTGLKRILSKLDTLASNDKDKIQILDNSIANSWRGIFELKGDNDVRGNNKQNNEPKQEYNFDCFR